MEVTHYAVPSKEPAAYLQAKVYLAMARRKTERLLCYSRFAGNDMYIYAFERFAFGWF